MASKLAIDGLGEVDLIRNSRSKRVKLRINHDGRAEVTAPPYVPIFVIKRFVASKIDWIEQHQSPKSIITDGMKIGRGHYVKVSRGVKFSVKNVPPEIKVVLRNDQEIEDNEVQTKLESVAIESLRKQAKINFPSRVGFWASKGAGTYKSVSIKLIKSRWGSYTSEGKISLSLFMAQLPDELIDYVIVHELSHSVHMNHSPAFWKQVEKFLPDYKKLRKDLKSYNMRVNAK